MAHGTQPAEDVDGSGAGEKTAVAEAQQGPR